MCIYDYYNLLQTSETFDQTDYNIIEWVINFKPYKKKTARINYA